jgi:Cys-tRNA(Pro)/Cys-tRNA(Cys) deacylase
MTPAINTAKKSNITYHVHEYSHDPNSESYGDEAALKLGKPAERVFKTLVISLGDNQLAVAVIPVSSKLSMKLVAKACKSKKATMASKEEAERSTGYVLGGISPLGQKKPLKTVIDISAEQLATIFVSAGKRGLEIELSPLGLQQLTNAVMADISQL